MNLVSKSHQKCNINNVHSIIFIAGFTRMFLIKKICNGLLVSNKIGTIILGNVNLDTGFSNKLKKISVQI